jgi:hypothetical protein
MFQNACFPKQHLLMVKFRANDLEQGLLVCLSFLSQLHVPVTVFPTGQWALLKGRDVSSTADCLMSRLWPMFHKYLLNEWINALSLLSHPSLQHPFRVLSLKWIVDCLSDGFMSFVKRKVCSLWIYPTCPTLLLPHNYILDMVANSLVSPNSPYLTVALPRSIFYLSL